MATLSDLHEDVSAPLLNAVALFLSIIIAATCTSYSLGVHAALLGVGDITYARAPVMLVTTLIIAVPIALFAVQQDFKLSSLRNAIRAIALTDKLTGLLTRDFFASVADAELRRMEDSGETCAVAVFEVDGFARLSDEFGPHFADHALRQVSALAYAELRGPFDKLARWGEDVFIVLLSGVSIGQAESVCERIRQKIELSGLSTGGHPVRVTVTAGVAAVKPGATIDRVFERVDAALREARRFGRNQVRSIN
ncbi:MAG: GGDEF domain-containing protein [Pseudomonadota bacterium]